MIRRVSVPPSFSRTTANGDGTAAPAELGLARAAADLAGAHAARLMVACEAGHQALFAGDAGAAELADAERIGVGAQKAGEVVRRLAELRAAVRAGSVACYRGQLASTLSEPLRRHLSLTDPLFPAA